MSKSTARRESFVIAANALVLAFSMAHVAHCVEIRVLKGEASTFQASLSDVSDDGLTAVGAFQEFNNSLHAAAWSLSTAEPHDLTEALEVFLDDARGVTGDGSIVVGTTQFLGPQRMNPFRWTEAGGREWLPLLFAGGNAAAYGISADGGVIAGTAHDAEGTYRAVYWQGDEIIQLPDNAVGFSEARMVSSNGDVLVGFAAGEAALWNASRQLRLLGTLPGTQGSLAYDVSSDGQIVVGNSDTLPFLWSESTGMVDLGLPDGAVATYAYGVSGDGGTVVGSAVFPGGPGGLQAEAMVLGPDRQWQSVEALLDSLGRPTEWQLTTVRAVTPDGRTMVGEGIAPNGRTLGWAITIPEPPTWPMLLVGVAIVCAARMPCPSPRRGLST